MKLAFGYKMRVAKDTSVDYLISKYGGQKITFAKPLYDALYSVQDIFNLEKGKDRKFLQMIGDWAREKDDNIFVNLALNSPKDCDLDYNKTVQFNGNIYCNDLRFMIEYKALKKDGWKCIKINRNTGLENNESKGGNHRSETELDILEDHDWDYIIDNNGSFEDLYIKLDEIVKKFN